jgi:hypothetical protein
MIEGSKTYGSGGSGFGSAKLIRGNILCYYNKLVRFASSKNYSGIFALIRWTGW